MSLVVTEHFNNYMYGNQKVTKKNKKIKNKWKLRAFKLLVDKQWKKQTKGTVYYCGTIYN